MHVHADQARANRQRNDMFNMGAFSIASSSTMTPWACSCTEEWMLEMWAHWFMKRMASSCWVVTTPSAVTMGMSVSWWLSMPWMSTDLPDIVLMMHMSPPANSPLSPRSMRGPVVVGIIAMNDTIIIILKLHGPMGIMLWLAFVGGMNLVNGDVMLLRSSHQKFQVGFKSDGCLVVLARVAAVFLTVANSGMPATVFWRHWHWCISAISHWLLSLHEVPLVFPNEANNLQLFLSTLHHWDKKWSGNSTEPRNQLQHALPWCSGVPIPGAQSGHPICWHAEWQWISLCWSWGCAWGQLSWISASQWTVERQLGWKVHN